ncbi:NINE protein [Cyanobium sp. Morenito 9A2]|nr:NINE protein [Cyanobium sp. Morenito 9A2]
MAAAPRPAPQHRQERRSLTAAYLLWALAFVGLCGLQRFYTRRPLSGAFLLLTFGFCGLGQLLDLFLVPRLVQSANRREPALLPLDRQLLELARRRGQAGFTINDALLDLWHQEPVPIEPVRQEIERLLFAHLLDVGNDDRGRVIYREP